MNYEQQGGETVAESETEMLESEVPAGDSQNTRRDDDGLWKVLVEQFFYPMLERGIPALYADADLDVPPRFLDKELIEIKGDEDELPTIGRSIADFLVSVTLRDGRESWVLLHIEIQGSGGGDLPFRMYFYKSRIFSKYKHDSTALAIITDSRPAGEPDFFESELYGAKNTYRYNNLVVAEQDEAKLIKSDNPFDLVLLAAKRALQCKADEVRKHAYLKELSRILKDRGWSLIEKRKLLLFCEKIISLKDKELFADFVQYQKELYKEDEEAVYLTMAEKFYIEQGREEGREEGIYQGIAKGREEGELKAKFDMARNLLSLGVDRQKIAASSGLPMQELERMQAEL